MTGDYEVRITAGQAFNGDFKIRKVWEGEVVYVDDDGKATRTFITSSYWQDADPNKRRTRAKLNIQLGRLRSHLKRTGKRWEIEQQEKRAAERAAKKAEAEAARLVRTAAPELLAALKEFVAWHTDPVKGREASIPIVARARAAISKAEGSRS